MSYDQGKEMKWHCSSEKEGDGSIAEVGERSRKEAEPVRSITVVTESVEPKAQPKKGTQVRIWLMMKLVFLVNRNNDSGYTEFFMRKDQFKSCSQHSKQSGILNGSMSQVIEKIRKLPFGDCSDCVVYVSLYFCGIHSICHVYV